MALGRSLAGLSGTFRARERGDVASPRFVGGMGKTGELSGKAGEVTGADRWQSFYTLQPRFGRVT